MLCVKGVFSLYLSIPGLRKGPGKFLTRVLEKSWIFSSERVGTLVLQLQGSHRVYKELQTIRMKQLQFTVKARACRWGMQCNVTV